MAEESLSFPGGASPYPYAEMKKYDLSTALSQGTLFLWLDDHYRKRVHSHASRGDEAK